jgi:dipeptidyl aminopeptidase/acylaminoacyl peptidase
LLLLWAPAAALSLAGAGFQEADVRPVEYTTFSSLAASSLRDLSRDQAWKKTVPEAETVYIPSTSDGNEQPALFYNSGSGHARPLLLVLHSWSANYQQHFSIPYGAWAVRNDWVFIHPNYRGVFDDPDATGSELAEQDILDALRYAKEHARIDESRIYIAGFSGGGMMTLNMVGRHPELWTAAVAWVPVYDLVSWYRTTRHAVHDYSTYIENSCGGPPTEGKPLDECRKRSPSSVLKNARGSGVHVYIATGIDDGFVPPDHTLRAFNDLAEPGDRFTEEQMAHMVEHSEVPPGLAGDYSDPLYKEAGKELLLERTSANVTIKIFSGGHDVIYNAGLLWLSRRQSGLFDF